MRHPQPLRYALLAGGFLLPCLLSCASPPDLQETMQQNGSASTQLKTARGLLTPAQSAAILDRLRREGRDNILDRHLAFEEALLDKPITTGNKVTLLQDGPATYQAMFTAIRAARDHINLETYIFEEDEVGKQFSDLLRQKQAQGVQVNLIYDSVGSLNTGRPFFDHLKETGIQVLEFNPVNPLKSRGKWLLNNRDHRKLLVVDGKQAFLGGVNISRVYSRGSQPFKQRQGNDRPTPWRDTHLLVEGPAVADFQRTFLETWSEQAGHPLPERQYFPALARQGGELVRAIGGRYDEPYSQIYLSLASAISHAEKQVLLTNAYFVPDPQLLQLLCDAARRGVDVRLILPGSTDSWATLQAGRSHYQQLLDAGVKLYERKGALLHAKTAIVDGVWSSLGSTNLDWRSFVHNNELNAEILSADFAAQMLQMFQRDQAASVEIGSKDWSDRSVGQRMKEWTARLLAYWL